MREKEIEKGKKRVRKERISVGEEKQVLESSTEKTTTTTTTTAVAAASTAAIVSVNVVSVCSFTIVAATAFVMATVSDGCCC